MAASRTSVIQLTDLIEDMIAFGGNKNQDVWPARLREIEGNYSLRETCEAVAKEMERRLNGG